MYLNFGSQTKQQKYNMNGSAHVTVSLLNQQSNVNNSLSSVWKVLKMSHLNVLILAFSTNFCPIKTDLFGNTVWPQDSGFQKLDKLGYFWHF